MEAVMVDAVRSACRRVSWTRVNARKLLKWTAIVTLILPSVAESGTAAAQSVTDSPKARSSIIRVDATPGHAINSFDPDNALGSSIDALSREGIDKVYTPHIIQEALSAGWGPITYRNNSELRMAAWHWNENGSWSDPTHQSGYFTGSTPYVRVLMTESSTPCDLHGADDIRNCVGYAIQDIHVGTVDSSGAFAEVQKNLGDKPTTYCSSSIDPWHSAADVHATGSYQ